ncbi:MAG: DUF1593 domain-containing protein [Bacteroidaceae bacterium]|nr:DUF1593 domain-containing protein [Bacteroidaceae bacterium]
MKRRFLAFIVVLFAVLNCMAQNTRLIVSSDIGGADPDDKQSLIHLLLHLDCIDLEGFIHQHAWVPIDKGAETAPTNAVFDAYEKVLPNLLVHGKGFPDADSLRRMTKRGQTEAAMAGVGEGKDTPGSEHIINVVDKKDARPVWIAAWSGVNTIAQALWKVSRTRSEAEVRRFVSKIRIYDVLGQDDAGAWIVKNFPDIVYIRNKSIYGWTPSDEWVKDNIQCKGALGAVYPDRIWATEGDTPSFLYAINNGLNCPEHPDWGGWGGRFLTTAVAGIRGMDWVAKSNLDEMQYDPYYMLPSAPEGNEAILRWQTDILNNLAARMLWTTCARYEDANHHPVAVVEKVGKGKRRMNVGILALASGAGRLRRNSAEHGGSLGSRQRDVLMVEMGEKGRTITFDASKSYDPDGNQLTFDWQYYKEAGTYGGNITLNADGPILTVTIPDDAKGKSIHIILRVTDNGTPALTAYRRIVISE